MDKSYYEYKIETYNRRIRYNQKIIDRIKNAQDNEPNLNVVGVEKGNLFLTDYSDYLYERINNCSFDYKKSPFDIDQYYCSIILFFKKGKCKYTSHSLNRFALFYFNDNNIELENYEHLLPLKKENKETIIKKINSTIIKNILDKKISNISGYNSEKIKELLLFS